MAFRHGIEDSYLGRRIGRRGLVLIIVGLAWVGIGSDVATRSLNRFTRPDAGANDFLRIMDSDLVGYLWTVCGVAAILFGILRHIPRIAKRDDIGFNAILTPPSLWFITYIWSSISYFVSEGEQGRASSIIAIFVWGLICIFIMIIAGWPDVPRSFSRPVADYRERDEDE